jgi:prolyl-tRNA synthetase
MKSLVMVADGVPVLALVRGDHSLSETKFGGVTAPDVRPAHPEEIREAFGADAGSLGPVGVKKMRIIADSALQGRRNMIAGANKDDYHLRHVTPGEDFQPEWHDLRQVAAGDTCETAAALTLDKTVEIGHIFKLGYKYSKSMGLHVTAESGEEITPIMGSYGIGIERILSSAVELYHDKDGMSLPALDRAVLRCGHAGEHQRRTAARSRRSDLPRVPRQRPRRAARRPRRAPGVKFKDADLIGIPYRVTVGKKLAGGQVEVVERRTKQSTDVAVEGRQLPDRK